MLTVFFDAVLLKAEPARIDQAVKDADGSDVQRRVGLVAGLRLPFVGVFEVVLDLLGDLALQEAVAGRQGRIWTEAPALQVA
ncbi:hypothetical protein LP415_19080 [Polaromonas sp. P1(28)-8]|nr:hypothetical protein LP415_19080 [Polaromonas sp. P1(28)-8]